jgi:hypothetical protein
VAASYVESNRCVKRLPFPPVASAKWRAPKGWNHRLASGMLVPYETHGCGYTIQMFGQSVKGIQQKLT